MAGRRGPACGGNRRDLRRPCRTETATSRMGDDNERRCAGDGEHAIRAQALADPGDGRHRPAHDHPRPDDSERRAAVRAAVAALRHRGQAVGGDGVRAGVRQPAAARRAAGRPARPQGHVHGRPGRLPRRVRRGRGGQRLDSLGAVLAGGAMFRLVYGFANAATHSWHAPSTWGFLAAAVAGLAAFAGWQARAKDPLLPPRVVLNRNRGGAYLAMLFVSAGAFGILLFLTFYLQTTLRYSPLVTGLAFLPYPAAVVVSVNVGQIVLMPRTGPQPLVGLGLLIAAGGMVWLTRIGVHSGYASAVLGPLLVTGLGIGQVIAPAANTGTFGVAPYDAGVAAATTNVGQQAGGSIGTSLLNTMVASATASYMASHLNPGTILAGRPSAALVQQSLVHGYTVGFC